MSNQATNVESDLVSTEQDALTVREFVDRSRSRGRSIWGEIQDWLFPGYCQLCEAHIAAHLRGGLCESCLRQIPAIKLGCKTCGALIPDVSGETDNCSYCKKGDWPAKRIYAYGTYAGKLGDAVVFMKQPGSEATAIGLGRVMADWFVRQSFQEANQWSDLPASTFAPNRRYDAIVSTPKYWLRRVSQRHNSPDLLAEVIGRRLGIPVWTDGLVRIRPTAKQGLLLTGQRKRNVEGAFAVNMRRSWRGLHILLIDDIVTSGSTIAEMARVLKRSGVASVEALCAARGVGLGKK